jgi:hypothetical protein
MPKAGSLVEIHFGNIIYFGLQTCVFLACYHLLWKTWKKFQRSAYVHDLNTRHKYDLHMPNCNLTKYQVIVYYTGIRLFNNLPPTVKNIKSWYESIKRLPPNSSSIDFTNVEKFYALCISVCDISFCTCIMKSLVLAQRRICGMQTQLKHCPPQCFQIVITVAFFNITFVTGLQLNFYGPFCFLKCRICWSCYITHIFISHIILCDLKQGAGIVLHTFF